MKQRLPLAIAVALCAAGWFTMRDADLYVRHWPQGYRADQWATADAEHYGLPVAPRTAWRIGAAVFSVGLALAAVAFRRPRSSARSAPGP